MTAETHHQRVLIVDFGSQVTQLIARRVREAGVYCEIHPFDNAEAMVDDQNALVMGFGSHGQRLSSVSFRFGLPVGSN